MTSKSLALYTFVQPHEYVCNDGQKVHMYSPFNFLAAGRFAVRYGKVASEQLKNTVNQLPMVCVTNLIREYSEY